MTLATTDIIDAVVTHALSIGMLEQVNAHAPKNAPGTGLTAAVTAVRIGPVPSSGLASASARLNLSVELFLPLLTEPADSIDLVVLGAVDALMGAYAGDFTLGGLVRLVDLFGADGTGLEAVLDYLLIDGAQYRHAEITLPLIVNDLWAEAA